MNDGRLLKFSSACSPTPSTFAGPVGIYRPWVAGGGIDAIVELVVTPDRSEGDGWRGVDGFHVLVYA